MTINISLPKEFLEYFKGSREELQRANRVVLAIELYLEHIISIGRAAELSGLHFDDFQKELSNRQIKRHGGPSTVSEADDELKSAHPFLKQA